jgi:hypothetical protein
MIIVYCLFFDNHTIYIAPEDLDCILVLIAVFSNITIHTTTGNKT